MGACDFRSKFGRGKVGGQTWTGHQQRLPSHRNAFFPISSPPLPSPSLPNLVALAAHPPPLPFHPSPLPQRRLRLNCACLLFSWHILTSSWSSFGKSSAMHTEYRAWYVPHGARAALAPPTETVHSMIHAPCFCVHATLAPGACTIWCELASMLRDGLA
jgi:hypothetical protein